MKLGLTDLLFSSNLDFDAAELLYIKKQMQSIAN